ncbi:MAG: ABC transporter permease subunit [Mogibacterium sp.]|nr:ABC transporter permease subunit [Mogibacterium sp.]
MKRNRIVPLLLITPFALITALVLAAIINIIVQSLGYMPVFGLYDFTLKYYIEELSRPEVLQSLGVSLHVALFSSVLAAILGTLICAALVRTGRTRGAMLYAVRLPILVPHTVVAVFTVALLAQTGLLARLAFALGLAGDYTEFPMLLYGKGYWGVILAYLWKEAPFIAYFSLALMANVSETLGEAAENLGASPLKSFFHITLPLSLPAIARGFIIVFIFAFGGYELPMLLGATMPKAFPVYTYIEFIKPDFKLRPYAMAMNGITLILSLLMALLYAVLMNRLMKRIGGAYEG